MLTRIRTYLEEKRDSMVKSLCDIISVPALAPEAGGDGEMKKAKVVVRKAKELGLPLPRWYDCLDWRVSDGARPNFIITIEGEDKSRTFWLITHLDVVAPGDLRLWETDPFKPVVKGGKVFGRGAEDNGQEIVAALYALSFLIREGIKPKINVSLAFVSDEESGSNYGMLHLLKQGVFKKGDIALVPDAGESDGLFIEVAEKSMLWLRFTLGGKQAHASMPHEGLNTNFIASKIIVELHEELYRKFDQQNELFIPPFSTFEPTMREKNVDNINTIPAKDVFYFDCRIIPQVNIDEVLSYIKEKAENIASSYGATLELEVINRSEAPPYQGVESPSLELLKACIRKGIEGEPRIGGISWITLATFLRKEGIDTLVWSKRDNTASRPNEYCRVDNLLKSAEIFILMMLGI
ncbi:MAG: M20 family metallo-hydrolase [Synergistetes bacterium]|nr:M20 family metallo-hydrolase [Synergistota bacterium]MCX8127399.1 M20 family metallo-hydrolase [Synergistota bacterium]MDW8192263.1 M20 family metallo-hydrolase [Synergistota bacterium]